MTGPPPGAGWPGVSVVVPTFDRPEALRACLEAIARHERTTAPVEVVVVDDGSPSPVVLDPSQWSRAFELRVLRQANAGPAAARNRGVAEARGDVIAFTDDDCRPESGWLAALVAALGHRPSALVGGSTWNGLPRNRPAQASQVIHDLVYEHFNRDPEDARFLASNNLACRRSEFAEVGGFDADFAVPGAEDRDLCDRWRASGRPLAWVREARVEHRHPQSLRQFVSLHHRYGRGAWTYQSRRRARGTGSASDDLGFHRGLLRRAAARLAALSAGDRVAVAGLLAAWQIANTAGYLHGALESWRGPAPT